MRIGLVRLEHRWQKAVDRFRIHNAKCQLPRLPRDQSSPDGISFWPDILSLVIKTATLLIDDDSKRNRVQPRDDSAVEFRRASVHRNGVKSFRVANRFLSFFQQSR